MYLHEKLYDLNLFQQLFELKNLFNCFVDVEAASANKLNFLDFFVSTAYEPFFDDRYFYPIAI